MFTIKYYNDYGTVSFGGGSSSNGWRITAADGLALPERSVQTARYGSSDEQEIIGITAAPRTITLSGDIIMGTDFDEVYSEFMKVLYLPGTMEISCRGITRRIGAVCTGFRRTGRQGKYALFAAQFICEDPCFEAASARETAVYRSMPCLTEDFKFPGMFSRRISRSQLYYAGSAETEPVFYVSAGSKPNGSLSIINHTSGERLAFDYTPFAQEVITIDVKQRKIYNSGGESLLKYLTDDSFFDGFHLYPGYNEIEVLLGSFNEDLDVSCKYVERFLEAVV